MLTSVLVLGRLRSRLGRTRLPAARRASLYERYASLLDAARAASLRLPNLYRAA